MRRTTIEPCLRNRRRSSAREHLDRAKSGLEQNDSTEAVTWLLAALEAAIVAVAESLGMETTTHHWKKAEVAKALHAGGHLSLDYSETLDLLNSARKLAGYEGDEPDLDDASLDELLGQVEAAVVVGEEVAG